MTKPRIGMIGLGVMGSNLIQNVESRGIPCAVFNRSADVTDVFMQKTKGRNFVASRSIPEFVASMDSPRQILIMVNAGSAVDQVLEGLIPHLSKGDIVCDLGNSYFVDTVRRDKYCTEKGIQFLGVGVSGGEEGALKGPSIMPGGPRAAWEIISSTFDKIAAKAPEACHAYIGPDGSGHFVKMVHNGIEYGDMQLIAEAYDILRNLTKIGPAEFAEIFQRWNKGVLSSFLIEITAKIFEKKDDKGAGYLVDKILDRASQKGTGKWTAQVALDLDTAIPTLAGAVDARLLSSLKSERIKASQILPAGVASGAKFDKEELIQAVHDALYCSKIVSYAQGMAVLKAASEKWNWDLKLDSIASLWRGGCIIRAQFLSEIMRAYRSNPTLSNLLLDAGIIDQLASRLPNWRKVVSKAVENGVPVLAFSSGLSYYDSYRTQNLPQNLVQAQRDFFGAHTYQRNDREGTFHTEW